MRMHVRMQVLMGLDMLVMIHEGLQPMTAADRIATTVTGSGITSSSVTAIGITATVRRRAKDNQIEPSRQLPEDSFERLFPAVMLSVLAITGVRLTRAVVGLVTCPQLGSRCSRNCSHVRLWQQSGGQTRRWHGDQAGMVIWLSSAQDHLFPCRPTLLGG